MKVSFARSFGVLALTIPLLVLLLLAGKGLHLAVDFRGGAIVEARYPQAVAPKAVQDALIRTGFPDVSVKEYSIDRDSIFIILPPSEEVLTSTSQAVRQVVAALSAEQLRLEVTHIEVVTPSVGQQVLLFGTIPLMLACIAIMVHPAICHGWRVALYVAGMNVRNIVIVLGLFLSAYIVFEWEFSLISLTAMNGLAILVTVVDAVDASRLARPDVGTSKDIRENLTSSA
ncbi:MAG TPA: hypothetical protein VHU22_06215 [Xanthobacteraceae bacterium]|jgi:preprotein translocase subunit SecF|nr:hypothetical protein [Xanthobacteraceae bacterium]